MSDLILSVQDHAEFMKHMPPLLMNGREYEISVNYDAASNVFKVISWFEKFPWGWNQDDSGNYPTYLHCRILDGCQAVHNMRENERLDQEYRDDPSNYIDNL